MVATYLEVEASDEAFEGPCFARASNSNANVNVIIIYVITKIFSMGSVEKYPSTFSVLCSTISS